MNKQDKINIIKEWYKFRKDMCEKYKGSCMECPLYESSDGWHDYESGEYEYIHNCKYEFEESYVEDIVTLMERER